MSLHACVPHSADNATMHYAGFRDSGCLVEILTSIIVFEDESEHGPTVADATFNVLQCESIGNPPIS